jgi:hypothetical protein
MQTHDIEIYLNYVKELSVSEVLVCGQAYTLIREAYRRYL